MKKNILVFGGGDNQVLLIQACKELGYYTVVTDPNPEAPGVPYADCFAVLPPKDYDAHRQLIIDQSVGGIVTCQMENPLMLMAQLAQEFGFLFPGPEVINRARNKFLMKEAFLQHRVPCAKGALIHSMEQLETIDTTQWGFPMIIKPIDSFSSRGVFRVDNRQQMLDLFAESSRFSSTRQVLVEEFLDGPEVSVECVVSKGKTYIVQITDKVITPYPRTVELAHFQPSVLPSDAIDRIKEVVVQAIEALGMDNTGAHAELKITTQGPKMVEIGARLGGDYISSYLTLLSTGVDMNKAVAQIAMGEEPDATPRFTRYSGIQYVNWQAGKKVDKILPIESLLEDPRVAFAGIFVKPGDVLPEITDSAKRHAFVITSGEEKTQLDENIVSLSQKLADLITVE